MTQGLGMSLSNVSNATETFTWYTSYGTTAGKHVHQHRTIPEVDWATSAILGKLVVKHKEISCSI